ncbi:MAG TPA: 50S ribosomal protein L11 methyltransferase [Solirubrobacteraceae bacterium]|nr:50S ribosomal protein L11 methyltransferase [Solirubrobacteraceae bacterium]
MLRLAIRVQPEQAELVLAELLELAPSGVEEVELPDGIVEYAVYGAPGELPVLGAVRALAGGAPVEVRSEEVADDWHERWREFHRPLVLEGRLTVRPPWEPPGREPLDLVIDPGQAFGTGAHATTRLCLELVLELPAGGPLLDLGSGSGVLAIAAARLGFTPVYALDIDPVAVAVTQENAALNGVMVRASRFDLRRQAVPAVTTVCANLLSPLLVEWAGQLERGGGQLPEHVVASGILNQEVEAVSCAFARAGLGERERRTAGDWTALLLARSLP